MDNREKEFQEFEKKIQGQISALYDIFNLNKEEL